MVQKNAVPALKAGVITILLSTFLVIVKAAAFVFSGSSAVLSSLTDSVIDCVVSGFNYMALRYSAKPADEDHRHGHGKIEGLAALLQGAIIAGGGAFLLLESCIRQLEKQPIQGHFVAIAVMVISLIIAALIVHIQNKALKASGSLTLEADKSHYSSDLYMNLGVILTVGAQYLGAPLWIDTLFAVVVAGWLFKLAIEILKKGLDMTLDKELSSENRERIIEIIKSNPKVLGAHDLRTMRSGMSEKISFDIEADPELSLRQAHDITKELEDEILKLFPEAEIMIHVDPHGETEDSRHKVSHVHHEGLI